MAELLGVRRSRRGFRSRGALLGAALVLAGCSGDRIVIAGPGSSTRGEPALLDGGDRPEGGTGLDAGAARSCPASPAERRELLGCWPTRQVGLWEGFFLGVPRYETLDGASAEFPPGDVRMRFEEQGTGTLSLGLPAPPGPAACQRGADAGRCAPPGRVLAGFEYRLERVRLRDAGERGVPRVTGEAPPRAGEQIEFEIRLGEPWDGGCTRATCAEDACSEAQGADESTAAAAGGGAAPSCRCDADGCAAQAPVLPIALTMSEDGRALRGAYRPRDPRLPEVRLELARAAP